MSYATINAAALPVHGSGEYLGSGAIAGDSAGIVTAGGIPASKPVYLFDAETMQQLKVRWSNEEGHYLFRALNSEKKYLVMVRDDTRAYRKPFSWDWVTPDTSLTFAEQEALAKQWFS